MRLNRIKEPQEKESKDPVIETEIIVMKSSKPWRMETLAKIPKKLKAFFKDWQRGKLRRLRLKK